MGDDPGYLKKYVKRHPDNKMAWYLLGKAYEDQGQLGKAKYCYKQSGEIYEAYERKKIPGAAPEEGGQSSLERSEQQVSEHDSDWDDLYDPELEQFLLEAEHGTEEADKKRSRRAIWGKAALLFALLLLLFFIPAPQEPVDPLTAPAAQPFAPAADDAFPSDDGDSSVEVNVTDEIEATDDDAEANDQQSPHLWADVPHIVYFAYPFSTERVQAALGTAMLAPSADLTALAQAALTADGRWALWDREATWLASAEKLPHSGDRLVRMHDSRLCHCEPADAGVLATDWAEWRLFQEEALIAASAKRSYTELYGDELEEAGRIARDYPHNILPGLTERMERFLSDGAAPNAIIAPSAPLVDAEDRDGAGDSAADSGELFPGKLPPPLEIIVDKANYRLALVSGNVILRNYEVELGGDLTPEGEFTITEKVKNPNGRSDGEFGSRGMTLSDSLYAIHGTNEPDSIGLDESNGCVRMLQDDLEELFDMTPLGTKVTITSGVLPDELVQGDERFRLPETADETNDDKVYQWLN